MIDVLKGDALGKAADNTGKVIDHVSDKAGLEKGTEMSSKITDNMVKGLAKKKGTFYY